MPFLIPDIHYPRHLAGIRDHMLVVLADDPPEQSKLRRCRYTSRCHSIYCPLCIGQESYSQKHALLEAVSALGRPALKFGTFTTHDVPIDALRAASREIMQAGRKMLKDLKVADYAVRLETSFADWSEDYHPHLHTIMDSPSGGRGYVSPGAWQAEWLASLPDWLHPVERGAQVKPVRKLEAACSYLTKSPFLKHVATLESAARIAATIREGKGLHKCSCRGRMAAQCA